MSNKYKVLLKIQWIKKRWRKWEKDLTKWLHTHRFECAESPTLPKISKQKYKKKYEKIIERAHHLFHCQERNKKYGVTEIK